MRRQLEKRKADPVLREKHNAENRKWKLKNPEKVKEYRRKEKENRAKIRELLPPKKRGAPLGPTRGNPVYVKYCRVCKSIIAKGLTCNECRTPDDPHEIRVAYDVYTRPSKCGVIT